MLRNARRPTTTKIPRADSRSWSSVGIDPPVKVAEAPSKGGVLHKRWQSWNLSGRLEAPALLMGCKVSDGLAAKIPEMDGIPCEAGV